MYRIRRPDAPRAVRFGSSRTLESGVSHLNSSGAPEADHCAPLARACLDLKASAQTVYALAHPEQAQMPSLTLHL